MIAGPLPKQPDRTGNPAVWAASQQCRHLAAVQGKDMPPRMCTGKAALQDTFSHACNAALSAPSLILPAPHTLTATQTSSC